MRSVLATEVERSRHGSRTVHALTGEGEHPVAESGGDAGHDRERWRQIYRGWIVANLADRAL